MPEKTLNDLPRELRMLHTKASEALQRDNFDYAIELFMQILEKEPANFDCRKALRAAQNGKSGGKGGGFFKRAFSSAGSSPMVAKGQMALRKNPLEAISIAEQILNTDAQSTGAHKLIAEAALAADLPRTAVLSCEILFEKSPKDKEVGMKYAEALARAGEKTKAENVYESLRREYPNDNEIFMALKNVSARKTMDEGGYGALATGQGSYRDILKDKGQTVRLEQENRQVKAQDSTMELIQDYETRLKADPNNLKLLRNLAEVYLQRNEFDKSLTYYDRLTAIDGGNDSALQAQIAGVKVKRFNFALSKLDPNAADYAEKAAAIAALKTGASEEDKRADEAVAVLTSRGFTERFIADNNLLPVLFDKMWDARAGRWKTGIRKIPTLGLGYSAFERITKIELDSDNDFINIQIDWPDRFKAAEWVNQMVERLNSEMRNIAIANADASLEHLQLQFANADDIASRAAVSRLIENEMRKKMMANVMQDYEVRFIDKATVSDADYPQRPIKPLMVGVGLVFGLLVGIAVSLFLYRRELASGGLL